MTNMTFVSRIKGRRDIHTLTADQFRALAYEARQAIRAGKAPADYTKQEHFRGGRKRPYYDWDAKYDVTPDDLGEQKKKHFHDFKTIMGLLHPGRRILYAERHGARDSGGYKISYRAFVQGICMDVADIPIHVRSVLGLARNDTHPYLDLSIYKVSEQLLGVIYGTKDVDKIKRHLVPVREEGTESGAEGDPEDPCEYLAQWTEGTEYVKLAAAASDTAGSAKKGRGRPRKAQGAATPPDGLPGGHSTDVEALRGPPYEAPLKTATQFFGRRFRLHEEFREFHVEKAKRRLRLNTVEKWCFIREGKHTTNNQYILIDEAHGARYRCHDEDCRERTTKTEGLIIPWSELPEDIRKVALTCFTESDDDVEAIDEALLVEARTQCQQNIEENWPSETDLDIKQQRAMLTACAKQERCRSCSSLTHFEQSVDGLRMKCAGCGAVWPKRGYIPLAAVDFPRLHQALTLMQLNVGGNLTINNNTVNILAPAEELYADFTADGLVFMDDPDMNGLFIASLQGTDTGLTRFASMFYRDEFHCTNTGEWFHFHDHAWSPDKNGSTYKAALERPVFLGLFQKAALHYDTQHLQTDEVKRKARMLRKLCLDLENTTRRDRLVADSIMKFHQFRPDFLEQINQGNKMAFSNGVFDFDTLTFRDGRPGDALTLRVKHPYEEYDPDHPAARILNDFFSSILPDPDVRTYVLKILGICCTTNTSQQHFYMLCGTGGNGKGKLMNLLEKGLGDYYQSPSPSLLTRPRESAEKANEAIMSLRNARVAVFQEANASDVINAGTMKSLTGEDTISTRGNYGSQVKFKPKTKILWVCNELCQMSENTLAVWRRVRLILFTTSFVQNPVQPHERKADPDIDKKLESSVPYLLSMLVHYFKLYLSESLAEPAAVLTATKQYRTSLDIVEQYVTDELKKDVKAWIDFVDLSADLKEWAKKNGYVNVASWRRGDIISEFGKRGIRIGGKRIRLPGSAEEKMRTGCLGWRFAENSRPFISVS
jgi:P4 family phage/plasmid primase-like protien